MGSVDVGVGHEDNAVVAEPAELKIFADVGAERGDECLDLFVGEGFVQAGFFDIENFAAQRQDCLKAAVAPLFGGASCAVSLDNIEFAFFRVAAGAIGQFAGQGEAFEGAFADDQVARFFGCFACPVGGAAFFHDGAGIARVFFHPAPHGLSDGCFDMVADFVVEQLEFVLSFELGFDHFDADDGGHPLAGVISGKIFFFFFDQPLFAGVVVDHAGDGGAQAGQVGAAVRGVDRIGEREDRF